MHGTAGMPNTAPMMLFRASVRDLVIINLKTFPTLHTAGGDMFICVCACVYACLCLVFSYGKKIKMIFRRFLSVVASIKLNLSCFKGNNASHIQGVH